MRQYLAAQQQQRYTLKTWLVILFLPQHQESACNIMTITDLKEKIKSIINRGNSLWEDREIKYVWLVLQSASNSSPLILSRGSHVRQWRAPVYKSSILFAINS